MSTLNLAYLIRYSPFEVQKNNKDEIFNEMCVYLSCATVTCFMPSRGQLFFSTPKWVLPIIIFLNFFRKIIFLKKKWWKNDFFYDFSAKHSITSMFLFLNINFDFVNPRKYKASKLQLFTQKTLKFWTFLYWTLLMYNKLLMKNIVFTRNVHMQKFIIFSYMHYCACYMCGLL